MDPEPEVIVQELIDDVGAALAVTIMAGASGIMRPIRDSEVQRPGLALTGFLDYFRPNNVQMIGKTELAYMATLDPDVMTSRWHAYIKNLPAAIIVSRSLALPEALLDSANMFGVCVLSSPASIGSDHP